MPFQEQFHRKVYVVVSERVLDALGHLQPSDEDDQLEHSKEREDGVDGSFSVDDLGAHEKEGKVKVDGYAHNLGNRWENHTQSDRLVVIWWLVVTHDFVYDGYWNYLVAFHLFQTLPEHRQRPEELLVIGRDLLVELGAEREREKWEK